MTILSIKHFETPELRRLKARIVFRGDDILDESTNLAVLQDLKASPTGLTGINVNLSYGSCEGNVSQMSDVAPQEFQHIKRPCVRLRRFLYGHPEAGFHWDAKFNQVMEVNTLTISFSLRIGRPSPGSGTSPGPKLRKTLK